MERQSSFSILETQLEAQELEVQFDMCFCSLSHHILFIRFMSDNKHTCIFLFRIQSFYIYTYFSIYKIIICIHGT